MPEAPSPPSVLIANRIIGGLVAVTLIVASALLVYVGKLTGEAFAGLVGTACVAAGITGVGVAATRRRRAAAAPSVEGTSYAPPRAVEPGRPRARGETTQTMRALDPADGDRGVRGFVAVDVLLASALGIGLALALPWGHLAALAGAVVAVLALALFAHVLPRRRTYARRGKRWLRLSVGLAPLAFALAGCPLPPPDGCTPRDTRCAPDGVPEVCSSTQRWTRGQPSEPCPERSTCCRALSPYGRELHACVPPSACLPDPAAVLSTPSALAGSQ